MKFGLLVATFGTLLSGGIGVAWKAHSKEEAFNISKKTLNIDKPQEPKKVISVESVDLSDLKFEEEIVEMSGGENS